MGLPLDLVPIDDEPDVWQERDDALSVLLCELAGLRGVSIALVREALRIVEARAVEVELVGHGGGFRRVA